MNITETQEKFYEEYEKNIIKKCLGEDIFIKYLESKNKNSANVLLNKNNKHYFFVTSDHYMSYKKIVQNKIKFIFHSETFCIYNPRRLNLVKILHKVNNYYPNSLQVIKGYFESFFKYYNFPNSLKILSLKTSYQIGNGRRNPKVPNNLYKKTPLKLIVIHIDIIFNSMWTRLSNTPSQGTTKSCKLSFISNIKNKFLINNFDTSFQEKKVNKVVFKEGEDSEKKN
jgi:hypothetical protein